MNCSSCSKQISADREWRIRENMSNEPILCSTCDCNGRVWAAKCFNDNALTITADLSQLPKASETPTKVIEQGKKK